MNGSQPIRQFLERYAARSEPWTESIRVEAPAIEESRSRLARGLPWIDRESLGSDPGPAERILRELIEDIRSSAASNRHVLDALQASIDSGSLSAADFLRAILDRDAPGIDSMAERAGVPTQILHFVGIFLARPFLAAAARGFDASLVDPEAAGAACPACGAEPALAFLLPDDGQRRFWCRCCATEWPVRRLRCLSCGNDDAGTLGYFCVGEETGRRVDYCEKCRRYIRTVDLRATARGSRAAIADLEDLSNGDLDAAAARERFVPLLVEDGPVEWRREGMGIDRNRGGLS